MAGMDWFRWHHGAVSDPKFQLVAKRAGASVAEVIAVWATLLEEASQSDDRGNYGALDFEAIDCALGLSDGQAKIIHDLMGVRNLLDPQACSIASWDKRQPKREREDNSAADRKREQRERDKTTPAQAEQTQPTDTSHNHVTPCHTKKSLEERRVEESREEGIQEALVAIDACARSIPTPGEVCKAMKSVGMGGVNPSNPKLLMMLQAGVTQAELVQAATESIALGKGFAYALAMAAGRKADVVSFPRSRGRPLESFAERDERAARERFEEATGRTPRNVIDITPATAHITEVLERLQ